MASEPRTYPSELPVLALRQTVVFPLTLQPLAISRPMSIDAINRALAADRLLFLSLQSNDKDEPEPADLKSVGTIAAIRQMAKAPNGGIHIIVEGTTRAKADAFQDAIRSGAHARGGAQGRAAAGASGIVEWRTPMVRSGFAILVSVAMFGSASGGQAPDTGTVAGKVTLIRVKGTPLPSTAYPGRTVGDQRPASVPDLQNVVVYMKDAAFRGALPSRTSELKQDHETFVPHVLAITRGSRVSFPNADPFFHNVFSLSSAASFDLGRYTTGKTVTQTFPKSGIVKVFCKIHSHMSATILVFDHPYFTIPDAEGQYELTGIPAGDYTIVGWHERVGERIVPVKVERGKTTTVNLSLPLEDGK